MSTSRTLPNASLRRAGVDGRQTLFTLGGIRIQVDWTWLVLAVLIAWSLATGFFPAWYPAVDPALYWRMGVAGAVGLMASILLHELGHALVARHFDIPISRIVLFIFGGVAEMDEEPRNGRSELLMALAGPAVSFTLAIIFTQAGAALDAAGFAAPAALAGYLALANGLLGLFNLIPAFPLDGGRVLRAALWWWHGDLHRATRFATTVGGGFGILLIVLGVFRAVDGDLVGGLWWGLIGLFLRAAATQSYSQLMIHEALAGIPVSRVMTGDPITVPPDRTVREFVEDYLYRYHHELFPVVVDGLPHGWVGTRQVRQVPREDWDRLRVGDIAERLSNRNCIDARADAAKALALMARTSNSRLLVIRNGRLVGVLALADLLHLLALRLELGTL